MVVLFTYYSTKELYNWEKTHPSVITLLMANTESKEIKNLRFKVLSRSELKLFINTCNLGHPVDDEVNATYQFFILLKTVIISRFFYHYKLSSDHRKKCNAQLHTHVCCF